MCPQRGHDPGVVTTILEPRPLPFPDCFLQSKGTWEKLFSSSTSGLMGGQEHGSGEILKFGFPCDMLPVTAEVPERRSSMSRGHPDLSVHLRRPFLWVLLTASPSLQKVRWGLHYRPFLWSPASGHGLWYPEHLAGTQFFYSESCRDRHSKPSTIMCFLVFGFKYPIYTFCH